MCLLCDGIAEEEFDRRTEMIFAVYGWMLSSVGPWPEGDHPVDVDGWAYTVGLAENFDHPDLLMLEGFYGSKVDAVNRVATAIVDGVDGEVAAKDNDVELVPLDPSGLPTYVFTLWIERYSRAPQPGDFLEVRFVDE